MWIKNVLLPDREYRFAPGCVHTKKDRIREVFLFSSESEAASFSCDEGEEILDGHGGYLLPGMIDIHLHGCMGADICDGTIGAFEKAAAFEASRGLAAIVPAVMTLPADRLKEILSCAAAFKKKQDLSFDPRLASLEGINMEGPFISPHRCGAQDPAWILPRSSRLFFDFQQAAEGLVRLVAIAPEEPSDESVKDFIDNIGGSAIVSLAHTNADYAAAMSAFSLGASHAVHLFNAMPGLRHREPGTVGAVLDSPGVSAELICDGVHVHPAVIRMAFSLLGPERILLVSDSMRAAGLGDGLYTLGGQAVRVRGKEARLLKDGALAGSVTPLPDCVRFLVKEAGIPLEAAVRSASLTPAKKLGLEKDYGSVLPGRLACLSLWNRDLAQEAVINRGVRII